MAEVKNTPLLVLSADTSTRVATVALLEAEESEVRVLGESLFYGSGRDHHSKRLLEEVERLLKMQGRQIRDVGLFVTSLGPGSFTGVRTALVALKGLAWALKRPLKGALVLEALAFPLLGRGLPVLCGLDAQKGEIYAALYGSNGEEIISPAALPPPLVLDKVAEVVDGKVLGVGEGLLAFREVLRGQVTLVEGPFHVPRASFLGYVGLMKGTILDPATAEPFYLRRPEAEERFRASSSPPHTK